MIGLHKREEEELDSFLQFITMLLTMIFIFSYEADLNMGLLCSAVSNSSDDMWKELLTMKIAAVPSIRPVVLKALTCTRNVELLNE